MSRLLKKITLFLISLSFFFFSFGKKVAYAQSAPFKNNECGFKIDCLDPISCKSSHPTEIKSGTKEVEFSFNLSMIPQAFWKSFPDADINGQPDILEKNLDSFPVSSLFCVNKDHHNTTTTSIITDERNSREQTSGCHFINKGEHIFYLKYQDTLGDWHDLCTGEYSVVQELSGEINISSDNGLQDITSEWNVEIKNVVINIGSSNTYKVHFNGLYINNNPSGKGELLLNRGTLGRISNKAGEDVNFTLSPLSEGTYTISAIVYLIPGEPIIASKNFTVLREGEPTPTVTLTPTLTPVPTGYKPPPPIPPIAPLCEQLAPEFLENCKKCMDQGKIWTAIGCFPTNLSALIKEKVFPIGLGFAGGAAFLYFLYGAFLILTCAGDPKKLEEAKQIIISALSGLLLIIFSVFLLKVIGADILKLPGFE